MGMRFGLFTGMGATTWDTVLNLWRHIEATGWDAACVTDHFMPNTPERTGDTMECWTTLAALAAVVPRMRVGTIVVGNTYRHPALLAKMAAQVDIISGGRLICGLGGGVAGERARGVWHPFYTVGEPRAPRRSMQVSRRCGRRPRPTTRDVLSAQRCPLSPKPVQSPYPELMIARGEKVR